MEIFVDIRKGLKHFDGKIVDFYPPPLMDYVFFYMEINHFKNIKIKTGMKNNINNGLGPNPPPQDGLCSQNVFNPSLIVLFKYFYKQMPHMFPPTCPLILTINNLFTNISTDIPINIWDHKHFHYCVCIHCN